MTPNHQEEDPSGDITPPPPSNYGTKLFVTIGLLLPILIFFGLWYASSLADAPYIEQPTRSEEVISDATPSTENSDRN